MMATGPGRRANTDEKAKRLAALADNDRRLEVRANQKDPDVVIEMKAAAAAVGMDYADFVRESVKEATRRVQNGLPATGDIDWSRLGTDQQRNGYLSRVPCGPLKAALDSGDELIVNDRVADELEIRDADLWVRAEGDSMKGVGIQDGFLVLLRPLEGRPPARGEIALMQFIDENGNVYESTLKGWLGDNPLRLIDGDGQEFTPPPGLKAQAVAVVRGVIGRLGKAF